MSHFSLNLPSSDTLWYTPTSMDPHSQPFFYHPSSTLSLSTTKYDDVDSDISTTASNAAEPTSSSVTLDHEYMFEKPLTPSDVGKLNRLVIPKQHAEKYFPLSASSSTTTTATESSAGVGGGGVLLGFEDESGKCWKFRYSYWNSSQSYVLTKGWSRYVKEKKLDAGDVVLFQRHRFEPKRFFIGWRRRGSTPVQNNPVRTNPVQNYAYNNNNYNGAPQLHQMASFSSYRPEYLHSGTEVRQKGRKGGSGNSKRVRLFGVNLIQEEEEEDEEDEEMSQTNSDGSSLSSSQGQAQAAASGFPLGPTAYNYFDYVGVNYPPNNHHYTHMDMNFPQDVNQMSNRLR